MSNKARAAAIPISVDMKRIYQIESSGNPKAHNPNSGAAGLGQITPIVLKEWNNMNPHDPIDATQLYDGPTNQKVADWYMNKRIPQMLSAYKVADTVPNRLSAYNAGIGYLVHGKPLPAETVNYIQKYNNLGGIDGQQ